MVEIAARTNELKPYGKPSAARGTFATDVVAAGGSSTGCDDAQFVDVNSDHNESQRSVKHPTGDCEFQAQLADFQVWLRNESERYADVFLVVS